MHRLLTALAAGGVAALALLSLSPAYGQDYSKVEVKAEKLSDTTYVLFGAGGNIGLSVGDDAVFVIDDQFASSAPRIKEAIARITKKPVQFVLNTHYHFDHTGGNEAFGKDGALIVAHDNVRRRLSSEQLIGFLGMKQPATAKGGLPIVTVSGDVTFHINGDEVYAFHVPRAHTDGDLIVHFRKSDVIHMGDVYFNGFYPFIDASGGGTADGVISAVDRVLALATDKTKIVPGHGPVSNKAELQAYRTLLATVTQRIKDLRKQGKTDDEIKAARPAAEYDAKYGAGFIKSDQFITMMLGTIPK